MIQSDSENETCLNRGMATPNFKPTLNQVLVEPITQDEYKGRIHIPDAFKQRPTLGRIAALGTARKDKNGNRVPWDFSVGEKAVFNQYQGTEVIIEEKKYLIMPAESVIGIIPE